MLAEARRRLSDRPNVEIRDGDLHDLPLADHSIDRARTDRVLQHVEDPVRVLAEIARVLKPGGLVGLAEPDWDTLVVADEDIDTSRRYAAFAASGVRNATIGRDAARLCIAAGLRVRSVEPIAVLYRDFEIADRFLGLRRVSQRAVAAGGSTRLPPGRGSLGRPTVRWSSSIHSSWWWRRRELAGGVSFRCPVHRSLVM